MKTAPLNSAGATDPLYTEMADSQKMANSAESAKGLVHFQITTFSRLSGVNPFYTFENKVFVLIRSYQYEYFVAIARGKHTKVFLGQRVCVAHSSYIHGQGNLITSPLLVCP